METTLVKNDHLPHIQPLIRAFSIATLPRAIAPLSS